MKRQVLLTPKDIKATMAGYQVEGVFNPGVAEINGEVHFLLRVAERPLAKRLGYIPLPRYQATGKYVHDWVKEDDVRVLDSRGILIKKNGHHKLTTISHLRHAISHDGLTIDKIEDSPALSPQDDFEEFGIEDARITQIDDIFYITYVAVSRHGIATALASTTDFKNLRRRGIIFPPENKNVVLFPERIGDYYFALHRPNGNTPLGVPEMWLSRSTDLIHWGQHQALAVMKGQSKYTRFGAGTPPIKLQKGWLVIYHAVEEIPKLRSPGKYHVQAILLELSDPAKVIAESIEPIPQIVATVRSADKLARILFPTGCIKRGSELYLYCGEKDTITSVTTIPMKKIFKFLNVNF